MQLGRVQHILNKFSLGLITLVSLTLVACGGGGGGSSANNPPTPAEVAAITPAQIATYSVDQFNAIGLNFKYLSDAALNALTRYTSAARGVGQIQSITAAQIVTLTPAQIRMIGAAGPNGTVITSQITYLNAATWAALANDPLQVAALTAAEITSFNGDKIIALDLNIKHLTDAALNALSFNTGGIHAIPQIQSITPAQIVTLTPAQVRMIGAAGPFGTVVTSKIDYLNSATWAALANDPVQVTALTAAEITSLNGDKIIALGLNIHLLTNPALNALSFNTGGTHSIPQIQSITPQQIVTLTPAQVRMIGAAGPFGTIVTSKIDYLNSATWVALANDPVQVAALTASEITSLNGDKIIDLGLNIHWLTDLALNSLSFNTGGTHSIPQIQSITPAQIAVLTPAQISVIAGTIGNKGISYLNTAAFAALSSAQIAILTATQKSFFSAAQHTSCGC